VTQLRIVPSFPEVREAGMMWRYPAGDVEGRECWWIVLPSDDPRIGTPGHPSRLTFLTTERAADPPHEMWEVTGEPPNITVHPSIDVMAYDKTTNERDGSYWHGWIKDGVMSPA
jgi:hypothetical protein